MEAEAGAMAAAEEGKKMEPELVEALRLAARYTERAAHLLKGNDDEEDEDEEDFNHPTGEYRLCLN